MTERARLPPTDPPASGPGADDTAQAAALASAVRAGDEIAFTRVVGPTRRRRW